jgi:hypothetical protein
MVDLVESALVVLGEKILQTWCRVEYQCHLASRNEERLRLTLPQDHCMPRAFQIPPQAGVICCARGCTWVRLSRQGVLL